MIKRIALLAVLILFTLLVVGVLWQLRSVVVVFFLALAIAATFDRPVTLLTERGLGKSLAIALVYGGVLGGLLLLGIVLALPILQTIDPFVQDLLFKYDDAQTYLTTISGMRPAFVTRLPTTDQIAMWFTGGQVRFVLQEFIGLTQNISSVLGQGFLALVLAIYWAADQARFERLWLSLLAPERRGQARTFWRRVQAELGAYIRSEIVQSLLAGSLLAFGYWLLGVKYPILLSFMVALIWLVPIIGGLIGLVIATIVGSFSTFAVAVWALLFTAAILALMQFWVERLIFQSDRYWGVLILLVMLALGDALGLIGLLIAPPIAVVLQMALNQFLQPPILSAQNSGPAELDSLRDRLTVLSDRVSTGESGASPRLQSLVHRLDELLSQAERATEGRTLAK